MNTTEIEKEGFPCVVRARVDRELYLAVVEEGRRRRLSLSDVVRAALLARYQLGGPVEPVARKGGR